MHRFLFKQCLIRLFCLAFFLCHFGFAANVPNDIRKRADKYIEMAVGQKYFDSNYRFSAEKSGVQQSGKITEYWVIYEYTPLKRIGAEPFVTVRLSNNNERYPDGYVVSYIAGKLTEPTITKEQAIELSKKRIKNFPMEKFHARLVIPHVVAGKMFKQWYWEVSFTRTSPKHSDCFLTINVAVNAITGEVLVLGPIGSCA